MELELELELLQRRRTVDASVYVCVHAVDHGGFLFCGGMGRGQRDAKGARSTRGDMATQAAGGERAKAIVTCDT